MFIFPIVTNSLIELKTPEWLDESYFSRGDIMTAVVARLANRNVNGFDAVAGLNQLWKEVATMAVETYATAHICGHYVCIYRMPPSRVGQKFELVMYRSL
jgi:hypothetical protein